MTVKQEDGCVRVCVCQITYPAIVSNGFTQTCQAKMKMDVMCTRECVCFYMSNQIKLPIHVIFDSSKAGKVCRNGKTVQSALVPSSLA